MLKPIAEPRRLIEQEGHHHAVRRGWLGPLHFENMPWLEKWIEWFLKGIGLWERGRRNVLGLRLEEVELMPERLPGAFDGFRLLWISDLHIDPLDGLLEKVLSLIEGLEYDICVLGGDYCFNHVMDDRASERMERLASILVERSDVYGLLGNHDRYAMAEILDRIGVRMLLNENVRLEKNGDMMTLLGVDDHHYFNAADFDEAMTGVGWDAFKLLLCHSPELYKQAGQAGVDLYLCGHTHGGQVCLPNGYAPVTCSSVPQRIVKGSWQYRTMTGYTCRGAGASGVPVRFNCPGEISLITLKKK